MAQDVPTSFPRKFLLEHFTTAQCGYCHRGMRFIVEYLQEPDSSLIWVGHHCGFGKDEYTIPENAKVASIFSVESAPIIQLNRSPQTSSSAVPFSPTELPHLTLDDDTLAEASVCIHHTFDPDTRQLDVTVSGQVANADVTSYLLTVLIKENYIIAPQEDFVFTWKQSKWKEFVHTRVVRDVITDAFGDSVSVQDQTYTYTLSYTIKEDWVPENCCIVAYITPQDKKPIINAEQVPLVQGTTGAEEYMPYGITESAKPMQTITFDTVQITQLSDSQLELLMIDDAVSRSIYGYPVQAVARVLLNTEASSLQAGNYPIQTDNAIGSITAGYRNDLAAQLEGSMLMYVPASKLKEGDLTPDHKWRIDKGEMVVTADGAITFDFTTYNKTAVKTTASYPLTALDAVTCPDAAPRKILRNAQLIILHDGVEYDVLGNTIR